MIKNYEKLSIDEREVLRYSSCPEADAEVQELFDFCKAKALPVITPMLCSTELDKESAELFLKSSDFARYAEKAEKIVLFAATIGVGIDRLIASSSVSSLAEAQMYQAIGAQQIESLCDLYCAELKEEYSLKGYHVRPRYSPGFGNLKLDVQSDIFRILDCSKIGLSLTESLIMRPSKSVTAFVAVEKINR